MDVREVEASAAPSTAMPPDLPPQDDWHGNAWWAVGMRFLILLVVAPYVRLAYRLRGHGRLPVRRGPTLVVANHQHDFDSVAIVLHLWLHGSARDPARAVATQRMFEPGFLSRLFPYFPFRRLNGGRFFRLLGLLPIENEPLSRTALSWAYALRRRYGDLALRAVFTPAALEAYALGARRFDASADARLSDLWSPRLFETAKLPVTHLAFRSPYREALVAGSRPLMERQMARIEAVVRGGATLYLTPEGRYSTDGRLGRLRTLLYRLQPLAEVWLAPISYDPLVGRRLSLAYRITPPGDMEDLATALKAARPVTLSQVLAAALMDGALHDFTAAEAIAEVERRKSALPAGAYLDPAFAEVPSALVSMVRRGWLTREDGRYRLAARRHDRRFPDVDDIVAYQARFHRETLDALGVLARRADASLRP